MPGRSPRDGSASRWEFGDTAQSVDNDDGVVRQCADEPLNPQPHRSAATAAMLGTLYVSSPSPVLALMLTAALVPGSLLLNASRSELAELERRWLGWRLLPGR